MGGIPGGGRGGGGACFVKGTRILTVRGEVKVEDLSTSDVAITASGEGMPIRWIGSRRLVLPPSGLGREHYLPVRISRDALADNVPKRDLYVSGNHAVFVDGMLIPASSLVNGSNIAVSENARDVVYYHVELSRHALVVAEGAPAESYLERSNNRAFFANAAGPVALRAQLPESAAGLDLALGSWTLPRWLVRAVKAAKLKPLAETVALHLGLALNTRTEGQLAPTVLRGKVLENVRRRLAARAAALAARSTDDANVAMSG
jgi:collagen type I alpha